MTIDPNIRQTYWDRGWVVVENVFTRNEAETIGHLATEYCKQLDAQREQGQATGNERSATDGTFAPRKLGSPFRRDPRFRDFALDPRLSGLVAGLIGHKPLLAMDQIFMKPPRHGSPKPYHQDNAYFKCKPDDHVITAWIALDDVDETNGCLRYIDGSHKEGILPHTPVEGEAYNLAPAPELIDLSRERCAVVGKGGVVFHHGTTLHTSHRNDSDRWRRAFATHWVSTITTCPDAPTLDNAYFHLPEYPKELLHV